MMETQQDGSIFIHNLIENCGARMIICCVQESCVPGGTLCHVPHGNNRPNSFHRFRLSTFGIPSIPCCDFTETDLRRSAYCGSRKLDLTRSAGGAACGALR